MKSRFVSEIFSFLRNFGDQKREKFHCPFCKKETIFNNFGDPIRFNVQCTSCGSLERHRFLYYLYKILFLGNKEEINLLHMAPEECIYNLLIKSKNIKYIAADLHPENIKFTNCKKEDFTSMSFKDHYFDIILANQVMEHIKDEQKFLSEIKRCLKDDGCAIINIPYNSLLEETLEDDNVKTDEERKKYYGQEDHVRMYGKDAYFRFLKMGFIVNQVFTDVFPKEFVYSYKLECENLSNYNPGGYFILKKRVYNN